MRVGNDLVNPSNRVSANVPQLRNCFIDDWRNFGDLFRGQLEFGAEPFFHSCADPLGMMQFKEMMPGIGSPNERAGNSTRDKHQKEARNEFPLQRPVHFKTHPGSPNPRWRIHSPRIRGFRGSDLLHERPRSLKSRLQLSTTRPRCEAAASHRWSLPYQRATAQPREYRIQTASPPESLRPPAPQIAATDRCVRFSSLFFFRNFRELLFHFLPGSKCSHFNECRAPAGDLAYFFHAASLEV